MGSARVAQRIELPENLSQAQDIRWLAEEGLALLAVLDRGVVEISLGDPPRTKTRIAAGRRGSASLVWAPVRLATNDSSFVVAGPSFELAWVDHEESTIRRSPARLEFVHDVDLSDQQLAVLGVMRAPDRELAPDGAIGWIGSGDDRHRDLKPIHFSPSGRGAEPMVRCGGVFGLGSIRLIGTDQVLIVPGGEPGVFLYSTSNSAGSRLIEYWRSEDLGLELRCDDEATDYHFLAANSRARWNWIQRFRTVDDILALPQGPALVLRLPADDGTRWQLAILKAAGDFDLVDLPIVSPSRFAHLKGDARDEEVVFLLREDHVEKPSVPTQVVVVRLE